MNNGKHHYYDQYDPYNHYLQTLVCDAGLSTATQERLLNGQRQQVATEFGLSAQEIKTAMGINAGTLRDSVSQLSVTPAASAD